MIIDFIDKIADDLIVGIATQFSDRSFTEQLRRNINYQIEQIPNPFVKMFLQQNIDGWIDQAADYAKPFTDIIASEPPHSVDVARDVVKETLTSRVDSLADKIKQKLSEKT